VASWLPPHAVSDAILDVAFADEKPPLAVNLVHPRPIAWKNLMQPMRDAVYQKDLTSSLLPLIPFSQWVTRLDACAVDTHEANIRRVVSFPSEMLLFRRKTSDLWPLTMFLLSFLSLFYFTLLLTTTRYNLEACHQIAPLYAFAGGGRRCDATPAV
jgi:hypothetical protein